MFTALHAGQNPTNICVHPRTVSTRFASPGHRIPKDGHPRRRKLHDTALRALRIATTLGYRPI